MVEMDERGIAYSQAYHVGEAPSVIQEPKNKSVVLEMLVYFMEVAASPDYVYISSRVIQKRYLPWPVEETPISKLPIFPISNLDMEDPEAYLLERGGKAWDCCDKKLVSYETQTQDTEYFVVSYTAASLYIWHLFPNRGII